MSHPEYVRGVNEATAGVQELLDENIRLRAENADLRDQLAAARVSLEAMVENARRVQDQRDALKDELSARELARWNWEQSAIHRLRELNHIRSVLSDTAFFAEVVAEMTACGHCDGSCAQCTEDASVALTALRRRAGLES